MKNQAWSRLGCPKKALRMQVRRLMVVLPETTMRGEVLFYGRQQPLVGFWPKQRSTMRSQTADAIAAEPWELG